MVKPEHNASYPIRCRGTLPNGEPCPALVDLSLVEKTICERCGEVYPPYRRYAASQPRRQLINK